VEIEWKDGHLSQYTFPSCATPVPARYATKSVARLGASQGAPHSKPGELVMFKAAAKPVSAGPVGKYALKFKWNDGHELGFTLGSFCGMCVRVGTAGGEGQDGLRRVPRATARRTR